jgi:hypothetical protein
MPAEWKALVDSGAVELLHRPLDDEGSPGIEVRLLRFRRDG